MNNFNAKEIRTIFLLYQKVNYNNPAQIKGSLELMEQKGMLGSPQGARFKERLYSFCDENNVKDMSCVFCGSECINRKGLLCASCEAKFNKLLEISQAKAQAAKESKEAAEEAGGKDQVKAAAKADGKAQAKAAAKADGKAQVKAAAKADGKAQAKAAAKAGGKAQVKSTAKADGKAQVKAAGEKIKAFGKMTGEKISPIGKAMGEKAKNLAKNLGEKAKSLGKTVGDTAKKGWSAIKEKSLTLMNETGDLAENKGLPRKAGQAAIPASVLLLVIIVCICISCHNTGAVAEDGDAEQITAENEEGQGADTEGLNEGDMADKEQEVSSLSIEEPVELLSYVGSSLEDMEAVFGSSQASDVDGIRYFKNIASSVVINSETQTVSYIDLEEGGKIQATLFGIKCGMTREEIHADFEGKDISEPSATEGDNDYYFFQLTDKDFSIGLTINYSDNKAALISVMIINQ